MKHILITGCSSGFGFMAAKHLAEQGHHVYASMRNVNGKNAKKAMELLAYANEHNLKIEVHDIDVTSDESVHKAISKIDKVDVLINNAGRGYGGPVEAFSSQQLLSQLDLNIVGTLRVANAVLPKMRKQRSGLIIQVSSVAGRGSFPGYGIYCASKWGLEGVSEAMRYELAPLGIDVVLVEPGPFSTDFLANIVEPKDPEINADYQHVKEFIDGFETQVKDMYENNKATNPLIVAELFETLINTPAGKRPLRSIAGLDFGFQALNDVVEPIRKSSLESMNIGDLDGPKN
ncbi:MAG: SDR family oxidoreductase [Psychroserpens sp.]|uniref:SDR family oxidoreductase n=1 Tax=Psychroserpens sp. TaxID=2020870 RepID=UPI003C7651C1